MRQLKTLGQRICDALGCPSAELSILITHDSEIAALNRTWRGKDQPTDVLSFSQIESSDRVAARNPTRVMAKRAARRFNVDRLGYKPVLGDIVISVETARRQARRYGNNLTQELERLLVHGALHLLGHDHVHGGHQARLMRTQEIRVLRAIRSVAAQAVKQSR